MMWFESEKFGKCEILCFFKDVAIVELEKNIEKYLVTTELDFNNKRWNSGCYCKDFKLASQIFNNLLEIFYMVSFKI